MNPWVKLELQTTDQRHELAVSADERYWNLAELLRRHEWPLNTRCGQRGVCDGCVVELLAGRLERLDGQQTVDASDGPCSVRACQFRLVGPERVVLRVPVRSLLRGEPQVLTDFRLNVSFALNPLWQQLPVRLTERPVSLEAVTRRLRRRLDTDEPVAFTGRAARELERLSAPAGDGDELVFCVERRPDGWLVSDVLHRPLPRPLGVAVDLGTTTVVVLLVDLTTGRVLARAAGFNRQVTVADDVLSRINLCRTDPETVPRLRDLAAKTVRGLLRRAWLQATRAESETSSAGSSQPGSPPPASPPPAHDASAFGASSLAASSPEPAPAQPVPPEAPSLESAQVAVWAVAGNTTMLHLLAGVDPSPMGVAPFTARFTEHRVERAAAVRLREPTEPPSGPAARAASGKYPLQPDDGVDEPDPLPKQHTAGVEPPVVRPDSSVHLLPGAAAYVGADLCAGILSSGMLYDDGPCLLVDIGTNGEIILKHGDRLVGCATAAGPAFEGGGLTCGTRAGRGAVGHLWLDERSGQVRVEVIQDDSRRRASPHGICGSGYIDFLAEGRRCGLLTPTGRFADPLPAAFAERVERHEELGRVFRVARGTGGRSVVVSEADVASLLQAKGAIAAGILTLLEREGLRASDVRTLYLAGGFGMFLSVTNAIDCGLLPGFRAEQVTLVGNTSLAGAYLALLDASLLDELARIGRRLEVVELNLDPGFESRYIDQMSLP